MGVSDHKCLACNASLKFDPKSQKWICDYCGSEFTLKDFRDEKGKKREETPIIKTDEQKPLVDIFDD